MTQSIGRNRNTNDVADVKPPITLNDTTAVVLAAANPNRIFFRVGIVPVNDDLNVFVRLYAASDDNLERGIWIGQFIMGNNVFFVPSWPMPSDNIYPGEISAILKSGVPDLDVYVTEY